MKTLVRTNGNMFPSIPSLLNNFYTDEWLDSSLANWEPKHASLPAVNVKETNDDFQIEVAAPGMKRDNFQVQLDNNVLTISAQHEEMHEENRSYARREFNYQSFQRRFSLPESKVEGDRISARYVDGILQINIPKREEAKVKPVRQIAIE